jgi:hypothetical protein
MPLCFTPITTGAQQRLRCGHLPPHRLCLFQPQAHQAETRPHTICLRCGPRVALRCAARAALRSCETDRHRKRMGGSAQGVESMSCLRAQSESVAHATRVAPRCGTQVGCSFPHHLCRRTSTCSATACPLCSPPHPLSSCSGATACLLLLCSGPRCLGP